MAITVMEELKYGKANIIDTSWYLDIKGAAVHVPKSTMEYDTYQFGRFDAGASNCRRYRAEIKKLIREELNHSLKEW